VAVCQESIYKKRVCAAQWRRHEEEEEEEGDDLIMIKWR
jgi:hypothetical protein